MPVMLTRWVLVASIVIAGCGKKADDGAGSASSAAAPDPDVEKFVAGMMEYGNKSLPMMMKFDGDCGAIAEQMLTLEPLAQSLRKLGTDLQADPDKSIKMKLRMRDAKGPAMAHYDEVLKPFGATMADVEKKEGEIKAKCASDPKYQDAEERTGLMKKKSK